MLQLLLCDISFSYNSIC